ncbi:hypothetical protein [Microbacterium panaciterrae]|uniref:DUF1330 domain-containing protein n=1 Tax=Microbacterium panaciterrae TaxID=985759 RepID=A0ABP8P8E9_9MICO
MPITLCCLLWANLGRRTDLHAYEDAVLALLRDHDAEIVQRAVSDGSDGSPHEIQFYAFASQDALDDYLADPRRLALSEERDRVVARTALFPVSLRPGPQT